MDTSLSENLEAWLVAHALTMGLLKEWGVSYDPYRKALVVPVHSLTGRYCFDIIRHFMAEPKYELSPPKCRTSVVLYGLNRMYKSIRSAGYAVVVEGFSDAIALTKAQEPAVSAITSSLSVVQAAMLHIFTNNLIIFGDGDDAGRGFARRHTSFPGLVTGLVISDHDPASAVAAGISVATMIGVAMHHPEMSYIEFGADGTFKTCIERQSLQPSG